MNANTPEPTTAATSLTVRSWRIDQLPEGAMVELWFTTRSGGYSELAVFTGITGSGDERRANFTSANPNADGGTFDWEAYRYCGRWSYGSSAQTLRLVAVHG